MAIAALLIYGIIGIMAGFLGGLLGIGGGLVVVPALLFVFDIIGFPSTYAMQTAIGTSLGAMVFTSASSAWAHIKQKGVVWSLFYPLTPGIICGAILGALIANYLPSQQLKLIFAFFACLIGIYFLLPFGVEEKEYHHKPPPLITFSILGVIIGVISSIMGIGGGIITVPILTYYGVPIRNAVSTSAVTGFFIAIFGAVSFAYLGMGNQTSDGNVGYLFLPAFISIGLTSCIAAPFGASFAYKLPRTTLKRIFGVFLIFISIMMYLR